ncbi:MAG: M48 family metalloprotease [Thermoproteota archaeon]|nr:M48 family metalloprotease [Candidatus Brockarchaeota archaeon]
MLSHKWLKVFTSILIIILTLVSFQTSASDNQGSSITIRLIDEKPLVEISGGIFNLTGIIENLKKYGYELRKYESLLNNGYIIVLLANWSNGGDFLLLCDFTEILPYLAKPVRLTIEHPPSLVVTHNLTETHMYEDRSLLIAIEKVEMSVWTIIISITVLLIVPSLCVFAIALWGRRMLKLSQLGEYQVVSKRINRLMIIFNYVPPAVLLVGFFIVFLPAPPLLGLPLAISVMWRIAFRWAMILASLLTLFIPFIFLLLIWVVFHNRYLKPVLKEIPSFRETLKYEKDFKRFLLIENLLPFSLILVIITISFLIYDSLSKLIQYLFLQQFFIIIGLLVGFAVSLLVVELSCKKDALPMDERLSRIFSETVSKAGLKNPPQIIKVRTFYKTVANAGVVGLFRRRVVVTELAEKSLNDEELHTVLLHEIGHIKHNHMPMLIVLNLIFSLSIGNSHVLLASILRSFKQAFNAPDILVMLVIIMFYITLFILWFLTLYFLMRVFERKADAFVLKIGINPEVYIRALVKLNVLNLIPIEVSRVQEAFQTHPTVIKRLRKVAVKYGVNEERLKEIVDNVVKELYEDKYGDGSK